MKKNLLMAFSILMVFSMLLAACATPTPQTVIQTVTVEKVATQVVEKTVEVTKQVEVQVTPTPVPSSRKGAWVDQMIFTSIDSADSAVTQLKAGEIDIYAYGVGSAATFKAVQDSPELTFNYSYGSADEISYNTATAATTSTLFTNGELNPFSNAKIREATNWLIDRNYVVQEIFKGLAVPKILPMIAAFPDAARYVDVMSGLTAKYAYNPDKAKTVIQTEMEGMGAKLNNGKWEYNGKPLTMKFLIRTEDQRKDIGDYFANQLETVGFTVDRQYKTRSEASPIWVRSDAKDGKWNLYTGGWITTAVSRDDGSNYSFYYTKNDYPISLFQNYRNPQEFEDVALKLRNNDFKTMDERRDLFTKAMTMALENSERVWVVDLLAFTPRKANVQVAYDLAGSVAGSLLYPFTVRFTGQEGGTMKIAQPGILVDPWNPLGGSNWIYDSMPIRAISDYGVLTNPYTGLALPQKIAKATVEAQEGLPIAKTLDWVDLKFSKEIQVPGDAWVDWNAKNQVFVTAAEKYTSTQPTAKIKVTVTYPADLFKTVTWHDGSPLSVGDFVMGMIEYFDPGKKDSPNYDEALASTIDANLASFKGVKIVSVDPLTIETYTDLYALDAENNVTTWWPGAALYGYGPAAWHNLAVGLRADADKKLAFTTDKASALKVEWMNFLAGPSLDILNTYLVSSTTQSYIPFAPTLGKFVTADEAKARWDNLTKWYESYHHFFIGTGPFYVYKAFTTEKTLILQRNPNYPDSADKWSGFGEPKLATTEVDGPGNVKIGSEAKFNVTVTYKDAPYPTAEITAAKFLLFNAKGDIVLTGDATAAGDGAYTVDLTADQTKSLEAGSNKLQVVISPLSVSVPSSATFEFVTAP